MIQKILGKCNKLKNRFIDFTNLKRVAKELGETLNDDELHEMIHHIHILRKTECPE